MYTRLQNLTKIPNLRSFFLFGPRATGKSTLVNKFIKSHKRYLIYDLLKSDDFLRLNSSPQTLRAEVEKAIADDEVLHVHLDEIQKVPALLDEVQYLIDNYPEKVRFVLTGSSARKLKRSGANLLASRAWECHLYPLTMAELQNDFDLDDVLQFGSIPPVSILKNREEKIETLNSYISTYLREEIQLEAIIRRLDSFHRFLEIAALCNGELLNFSDVGREAGIGRKTVIDYYKILEDTLIGFFLPSWGHRLSRKQLVEHGKFYFFDTGVVSALNRRLTATMEDANPLFGRIFEHFCILEFIRLHSYKKTEHSIGFFRTRGGLEIDLIQEKHGQIRAIEIKSAKQVNSTHTRGLVQFSKEFPEAKLELICRIPREIKIGPVRCIPYRNFFDQEWGIES